MPAAPNPAKASTAAASQVLMLSGKMAAAGSAAE